jgi:hypothetical protein
MTTTDYQKQATDFLEKFGITFRVSEYGQDMQTAPEWAADGNSGSHEYPHGIRYRVVLERNGRAKQLAFDFWGSIADRKAIEVARRTDRHVSADDRRKAHDAKVTAYDVLACISGDVNTPETFDDFCGEYGYDVDSRKAYATWERCAKFAAELRAFFSTTEERDALAEIS